MGKYYFDYYLHDNSERSEFMEHLTDQAIPESIARHIAEQRPFYEVRFECQYDTDTEAVLINGVYVD